MGTATKITLDEYAMTLIRLKARQLVGRYGFKRSDREDLEQDLTLDLLAHLDRFDSRKGQPATFMRVVVDRCAASLVRKRKALMRDYRRTQPLDELTDENGDSDSTEPARDDRDQRDLAIDMTAALAALPDDLSSIAQDLRDGSTLADIARQRGCSREVLRGKVRRIRAHLAQRGLDEYIAHQGGPAPRK